MNEEETTSDRVYAFIVDYKKANDGNSPSYRDIQEVVGVTLSTVKYILEKLADEGRIIILGKGKSRMIAIPGAEWKSPAEVQSADK